MAAATEEGTPKEEGEEEEEGEEKGPTAAVVVKLAGEALEALTRMASEFEQGGKAPSPQDVAACHAVLCGTRRIEDSSSQPPPPSFLLSRAQRAPFVALGRHPNLFLALLSSLFVNVEPTNTAGSAGFGSGSAAAAHAAGVLAVLASFGVGGRDGSTLSVSPASSSSASASSKEMSAAAEEEEEGDSAEFRECALVETALLESSAIVGAKSLAEGHALVRATAAANHGATAEGGSGGHGGGSDPVEALTKHAERFPVVGRGLLLWMGAVVGSGKKFVDAYHSTPVGSMLKLCKAVGQRHPPLRLACLEFVVAVVTTKPPAAGELERKNASTGKFNLLNDHQLTALGELVRLASNGGVALPAMALLKHKVDEGLLDRRTVSEFAQGLAKGASPPYSPSFSAAMAELSRLAGLPKTALRE